MPYNKTPSDESILRIYTINWHFGWLFVFLGLLLTDLNDFLVVSVATFNVYKNQRFLFIFQAIPVKNLFHHLNQGIVHANQYVPPV